MLRLGLDIGGTKIEAQLLDGLGVSLLCKRIATPTTGYVDFLVAITELVREIRQELDGPFTIGIGLPGAIDPQTGRIKNANCLFLNGQDLKGDLTKALGQPVWLANDADCFALSEAVDGAGEAGRVVFGIILGTGCGGGLVVNRQLIVGPNAITGEWGHNPLPGYDPAMTRLWMARASPATAAATTASSGSSPALGLPAVSWSATAEDCRRAVSSRPPPRGMWRPRSTMTTSSRLWPAASPA